jgi:hypothetical protein
VTLLVRPILVFQARGELGRQLDQAPTHSLETPRVEVEENFGQSAYCEPLLAK